MFYDVSYAYYDWKWRNIVGWLRIKLKSILLSGFSQTILLCTVWITHIHIKYDYLYCVRYKRDISFVLRSLAWLGIEAACLLSFDIEVQEC